MLLHFHLLSFIFITCDFKSAYILFFQEKIKDIILFDATYCKSLSNTTTKCKLSLQCSYGSCQKFFHFFKNYSNHIICDIIKALKFVGFHCLKIANTSWPVFIAVSMSIAVASRISPTTILSGRIRKALRIRSRIVT